MCIRDSPYPDGDLPGDAGGTPVARARTGGRYRGRAPVGINAPRAGLVLRHDLADPGRLRLADNGDHRALERGNGGTGAAVRCAGDRRIRARPARYLSLIHISEP